MLCLAQRQYSLLQAANLLTPDMISEFESVQQLVHKENTELGTQSPRIPGQARGSPLARELYLESSECHFCSVSLLLQSLRPTCSQDLDRGLRCPGMLWWEAGA